MPEYRVPATSYCKCVIKQVLQSKLYGVAILTAYSLPLAMFEFIEFL